LRVMSKANAAINGPAAAAVSPTEAAINGEV
jgi:hypothetical protein